MAIDRVKDMSSQPQAKPPAGAPRSGWDERPDAARSPMPPVDHPAQAIREAVAKVSELGAFVSYYVSAQLDAAKLAARKIGVLIGLGVIGAVAAAAVIVVAIVLLLRGIAGAFASLFPSHPWIGDLITAVIFLAIPVVAILVGMRILTRTFKTSTVQKYELRQRQQREQFGRNVRDEATGS